jgi:NAD(P)-dependent dehydrogenase (short-subunit alcohol dehydrogenase family)
MSANVSLAGTGLPSYQGQVALVTGAGAGLGRVYASYLAAHGAAVLVNDAHETRAAETAADIVANGGTATVVVGQTATGRGAEQVASAALTAFGSLDVLVNAVGQLSFGALADQQIAEVEQLVETNLMSALWASRAAFARMQAHGYGRIVNVTSAAGLFGCPGVSGYAAATAGVIGLTKSLAIEGESSGIRVNCLAPAVDAGGAKRFFDEHYELERERYTATSTLPALALLTREACELNGAVLSVAAGRVASIFFSMNLGVIAEDEQELLPKARLVEDDRYTFRPGWGMDQFLSVDV